MSSDSFNAQIIGVFFAETAKNIAKGSANLAYEHFNLFFDSEITALNLNDSIDAEEVTKQLEARPDILDKVQRKLIAHPKLAEEINEAVKETVINLREVNANTYTESAKTTSINQSGGQTAHIITNINSSPLPQSPKVSLIPKISFQRGFVYGSPDENYDWRLKLFNDGETTIRDFRVDIKFPNMFLNQGTIYAIEVTERRTEDYRLFRSTNVTHGIYAIYQDDEVSVFAGSYSISKSMRENGELERKVFISVFSDDKLLHKIEKKMSEFVDDESL